MDWAWYGIFLIRQKPMLRAGWIKGIIHKKFKIYSFTLVCVHDYYIKQELNLWFFYDIIAVQTSKKIDCIPWPGKTL